MESKNYFWELIFMLMPTRVSRRCLLIGTSFAEQRVWFWPIPSKFSSKIYCLHYFIPKDNVMESKNYIWEFIFKLMPTRISRRLFLLIGPSFAEKRVWFSQELPNFLQKYVAYTILSRKTCDGEQKLFLRINLHINAHKGIETMLLIGPSFAWKTCMIWPIPSKFSSKICCLHYFISKDMWWRAKIILRINLHINASQGIEKMFPD